MAMWTKAQCKVQWELFCLFIRIGLMTFGGGTSMLPILQRELADQRGWLTDVYKRQGLVIRELEMRTGAK